MEGMKIAVYHNEDMEMRKSEKRSLWPKKIQTGLHRREEWDSSSLIYWGPWS